MDVAVAFDACTWGSTRIKDTTFKATKGFVDILAKRCDGSHQHECWRPAWARPESFFPLPVKLNTQSHCAKHTRPACGMH